MNGEDAVLAPTRRMSNGEQLARAARRTPTRTALRSGEQRRSYQELDERVTRLARALSERGVGRGDRIAVHMFNRIEVVESYLAASRLGAIAVPINFRLVADEVGCILGDAEPAALVVDHELAGTAAAREGITSLRAVLATGDGQARAGPGAEDYEHAVAAAIPEPLGRPVAPRSPSARAGSTPVKWWT